MRPVLGSFAALAMLFVSCAGYGERRDSFFVEIGGAVANGVDMQSAGANAEIEDWVGGTRLTLEPDLEEALAIEAKAGYALNEILQIDLDLAYFRGFQGSDGDTARVSGVPVTADVDVEADIFSAIVNAKATTTAGSNWIMPYGFVGAGGLFTMWDADIEASSGRLGFREDHATGDDITPCVQGGIGVDFFPTEGISIGAEVRCLWDFEDISYVSAFLGVGFRIY